MSFHSSSGPGGASGGFKTPAPPSHRRHGSRSSVVTPAVGGRSSTTPRSTRTCVESLDTGTMLGSIFKLL
jgi:hypothetical protein